MIQNVDQYLIDGCGRCPLGGTPECKVLDWTTEVEKLREIILSCGLTEEIKWGSPCYTIDGKNVVMIAVFKNCCSISFFKGVALKDPKKLLTKPGENTQIARVIKFKSMAQIDDIKFELKSLIKQAITIEKSGVKISVKKPKTELPEELIAKLTDDPLFKQAFDSLTSGRQRGYIIYFSGAKQSKTRSARIEKCMPKILNGEGMHDKYNR